MPVWWEKYRRRVWWGRGASLVGKLFLCGTGFILSLFPFLGEKVLWGGSALFVLLALGAFFYTYPSDRKLAFELDRKLKAKDLFATLCWLRRVNPASPLCPLLLEKAEKFQTSLPSFSLRIPLWYFVFPLLGGGVFSLAFSHSFFVPSPKAFQVFPFRFSMQGGGGKQPSLKIAQPGKLPSVFSKRQDPFPKKTESFRSSKVQPLAKGKVSQKIWEKLKPMVFSLSFPSLTFAPAFSTMLSKELAFPKKALAGESKGKTEKGFSPTLSPSSPSPVSSLSSSSSPPPPPPPPSPPSFSSPSSAPLLRYRSYLERYYLFLESMP